MCICFEMVSSFILSIPAMQNSMEYEHEKFDRLQATLLMEDPATTAFYNAQLRTERRVGNTVLTIRYDTYRI